jgi:hypothetical protein
MLGDRIAIYIGMNVSARRYFWDPKAKKLSADGSWVIYPIQKGQTTATAPSVIGDWIVFQLNGAGSKTVASSIAAVHRDDAKRSEDRLPFGRAEARRVQLRAALGGCDPRTAWSIRPTWALAKWLESN